MEPSWTEIDVQIWERKTAYEAFRDFDFPWLVVGADLSLARALTVWKDRGISPYLAMVYAFTRAANAIPAFRQRLREEGRVIEHRLVHADYTVGSEGDSFSFRVARFRSEFADFLEEIRDDRPPLSPEFADEKKDHWIYLSCLPWTRFTHVMQPSCTRVVGSSIPKAIWGKFYQDAAGEWKVPVSVQAHHSLVDGIHMAKLFAELERILANAAELFARRS